MPIAFKEWAVTVRALAEGEQLVTLRKGGIREPGKHFSLDHERFFLYPTFDHQRRDLVRESHQPEMRRALEEGVWADGEPPAHALEDRRRDRAARPRADPRLGRGRRRLDGDRPARGRRAVAVLRLDAGLRREAAGVEAAPPAARAAAAHVPHPAPRDRQGAGRPRRLPLVARDHPRPAVRGHPGALRRGVRAGLRGDHEHRSRPAACRPTPSRSARALWPGSRPPPRPSSPATTSATRPTSSASSRSSSTPAGGSTRASRARSAS